MSDDWENAADPRIAWAPPSVIGLLTIIMTGCHLLIFIVQDGIVKGILSVRGSTAIHVHVAFVLSFVQAELFGRGSLLF